MPRNDTNRQVMPGEQTPGQAYASRRKKARRAERAQNDQREAEALGISVDELRRRRTAEAAPFLAGRRVVHHSSTPAREPTTARQADVRRAG